MTDATERRCGTCRHGTVRNHFLTRRDYVECEAPLPVSLKDLEQWHMNPDEGRDCPTWEARND